MVDPGSCRLYVGTEDGLRVARVAGDEVEILASTLADQAIRDIAVHPSRPDQALIGCGLRGWGLYRVTADGTMVEELGFSDRWVWGVERHPADPEMVFIGTEPPMVYRSHDGGATVTPCPGIDTLPSRGEWTFFHEPFRAGHVHGFALHPDRPSRIVAGVEHGALLRSTDRGNTWTDHLRGRDVHRVVVHPREPEVLLAGCGSGLYRSTDGGRRWHHVDELGHRYVHAIVIDPDDPARRYVYTDDDATIHRSEDGGATWQVIGGDLPRARPADTLRLHPSRPATVYYIGDETADASRLYRSHDRGDSWDAIGPRLPKTWRLAVG